MKFKFEDSTVEIKVTPSGAKKFDEEKSKELANDIALALIHASNFCTMQGMKGASDYYMSLAKELMYK